MPRTCPMCSGRGLITIDDDLPPTPAFAVDVDDAPTAKLPPIRDTIRRRPPAPVVQELTNRVELLEALATELLRELRDVDDDQGVDQ